MLLNYIKNSICFFDENFLGDKHLLLDQLLRMRRVRTGKNKHNVRTRFISTTL